MEARAGEGVVGAGISVWVEYGEVRAWRVEAGRDVGVDAVEEGETEWSNMLEVPDL